VTVRSRGPAPIPPRWFIRAAWVGHRAIYSITGGRRGLRSATAERWGMLRLRTVGRRTGKERIAILGYIEDGSNLVTKAMNGWADSEPAWWLNLMAHLRRFAITADPGRHPGATVRLTRRGRDMWVGID
jgi:F420H(2)-dependent quinone reductase